MPNSGNGFSIGMANGGSILDFFSCSSGLTSCGQVAGVTGNGFIVASLGGLVWTNNNSNVNTTEDTGIWRLASATVTIGNSSPGDYSGSLKLTTVITAPLTYATLPASPTAGQRAFIPDANTTTFGATVSSGGGSSKISVLYNGSNWVVD